jgi:hypothetical protein
MFIYGFEKSVFVIRHAADDGKPHFATSAAF